MLAAGEAAGGASNVASDAADDCASLEAASLAGAGSTGAEASVKEKSAASAGLPFSTTCSPPSAARGGGLVQPRNSRRGSARVSIFAGGQRSKSARMDGQYHPGESLDE